MKRHVFHPEAEQEYLDAVRYYVGIDQGLAGRFYDEIEKLIQDVRTSPIGFEPSIRLPADISPMSSPIRSSILTDLTLCGSSR